MDDHSANGAVTIAGTAPPAHDHGLPHVCAPPAAVLNPVVWDAKTVVFAGGGSGGHLFPGLALLELWQESLATPPTVHWIGSPRRMEATLIPERGIPFHPLEINYFRRSLAPSALKQNLGVLYNLSSGRVFREAERILQRVNADLVISLGSFVGGPVVIAANHAKLPSVLMAMDTRIGKGHQWAAPVAHAICVSTVEGEAQMHRYRERVYLTGTPVRPSLFRGDPTAAKFEFGLTRPGKTLLVLGGSQGASGLNAAIPALWNALNQPGEPGLNILHQVGDKTVAEFVAPEGSQGSYAKRGFIGNMASAYALADVVLCRAGANTLAEIAALGKPAILVPFPESAENHQLKNAQALAKAGVALCLEEAELDAKLIPLVRQLLTNAKQMEMMSLIAMAEARPQAGSDVSLVCEGVLVRSGRASLE